jgi:Gpi18-like mannosyltransferase
MTDGTQKSAALNSGSKLDSPLVIAGSIVLGLAIRYEFIPYFTGDYTTYLSPWYDFIVSHGGFAALKYNFSNYNPPYLYLLILATYLPVSKLVAIKLVPIVFDFGLAAFAWGIIRSKYGSGLWPAIAFAFVFLIPTVIVNSAFLGQADGIYTVMLLGTIYFLIIKKPIPAMAFFALAVAVKLQAIFFAPVILIMLTRKEMRPAALLVFPVVYLLAILPAAIAGRPFIQLLTVYFSQAEHFQGLSYNGPTAYLLLGDQPFRGPWGPVVIAACILAGFLMVRLSSRIRKSSIALDRGDQSALFLILLAPMLMLLKPFIDLALMATRQPTAYLALKSIFPSIQPGLVAGVVETVNHWGMLFACVAILAFIYLCRRTVHSASLTGDGLIRLSLATLLIVPFLLPRMHERYFYAADVVSVIYALYFPRYWYVPVAVIMASTISYVTYLSAKLIPSPYAAMLMGAAIIIVVTELIDSMRRDSQPVRQVEQPMDRAGHSR